MTDSNKLFRAIVIIGASLTASSCDGDRCSNSCAPDDAAVNDVVATGDAPKDAATTDAPVDAVIIL